MSGAGRVCGPPNATAEQIETLEKHLEKLDKAGKYNEESLREYFFARRTDLDDAIREVTSLGTTRELDEFLKKNVDTAVTQFRKKFGNVLDRNEGLTKELDEASKMADPKAREAALGALKPKVERAPLTESQYLALDGTYKRPWRPGQVSHLGREGNTLRLDPEGWEHIKKRHVKSTFDPSERVGAPVTTLFKGSPAEYLDILQEAVKSKAVVRELAKDNGEIKLIVRAQEWVLKVDTAKGVIETFHATGTTNKKLFEVIR